MKDVTDVRLSRDVQITAGTQYNAAALTAFIVAASTPEKRVRHEPRGNAPAELESTLRKLEELNARSGWPSFIDRILRKQGQINRLLARSSECLIDVVRGSRFEEVSERKLDAAMANIELGRQLNHQSRGHPWIRRARRPQGSLNAALALALSEIEEALRLEVAARGMVDDAALTTLEHLRWHAKEIAHLSALPSSGPSWYRRLRRDQFSINNYFIVALRYARLLSIQF